MKVYLASLSYGAGILRFLKTAVQQIDTAVCNVKHWNTISSSTFLHTCKSTRSCKGGEEEAE